MSDEGLFPKQNEISFNCGCPDWAMLCKHFAATLYAVGSRLDKEPLMFFQLRGIGVGRFVNVTIANKVELMLANINKPSKRIIETEDVLDMFGVLQKM